MLWNHRRAGPESAAAAVSFPAERSREIHALAGKKCPNNGENIPYFSVKISVSNKSFCTAAKAPLCKGAGTAQP